MRFRRATRSIAPPTAATVLAAAALLAPAASAAEPPRNAPELPVPSSAPPKMTASSSAEAGSVVAYRVKRSDLRIHVACAGDGRVAVRSSRDGRPGERLAAAGLNCDGRRAKVSLPLPPRTLARARSPQGAALFVTARAGGNGVRTPLSIRARGHREAGASAYWTDLLASCWKQQGAAGGTHKVGVPSTATFGARRGERVYWRAIVRRWSGGRDLPLIYSNWDSYFPTSFYGYERPAIFGIYTSVWIPTGTYSLMQIQSYSASTGYRRYDVQSQAWGVIGLSWQTSGYLWCGF